MTPPRRRGILTLAGGLAALVLVTGCALPFGSGGESGEGRPDLSRYYNQNLTWTSCEDEFQCASYQVPLDYSNPSGPALSIKILKAPAKDPTRRLGSLVVNPGGPGASGVEFAQYASGAITPAVMAQYDIVGFDPRGVAKSTPIQCMDGPQTDQFMSTMGAPANAAQQGQVEVVARQLGASCQQHSPSLTPVVGTSAAARDMDVLRHLLAEKKLNFLGISYGTLLGLVYADLFKDQVGRFVLDGVIDPSLSNSDLARGQAEGFQLALSRFIQDCPKHEGCPLPTGEQAGLDKINNWLAALATDPIKAEPNRPLNRPLAVNGVVASLYAENDGWPQLREAFRAGFKGDGKPMLTVVDSFTGRQEDGSYRDNAIDALYAVSCLDRPDRVGVERTAELAQEWGRTAPTFGPELAWGNLPCSTWPAPATLEPHPVTVETEQPVVLIGTRYDPATPYRWAEAVSKQLPNNRLISYEDDGHTGYGDSACVNKAVDEFLLRGQNPATGVSCPG